jgi:hypothetical protein
VPQDIDALIRRAEGEDPAAIEEAPFIGGLLGSERLDQPRSSSLRSSAWSSSGSSRRQQHGVDRHPCQSPALNPEKAKR